MNDKTDKLRIARSKARSARRGLQKVIDEVRRMGPSPISKGATCRAIEDLARLYLEGSK